MELEHHEKDPHILMTLPSLLSHRLGPGSPLYPPATWLAAEGHVHWTPPATSAPAASEAPAGAVDEAASVRQVSGGRWMLVCGVGRTVVLCGPGGLTWLCDVVGRRHSSTRPRRPWSAASLRTVMWRWWSCSRGPIPSRRIPYRPGELGRVGVESPRTVSCSRRVEAAVALRVSDALSLLCRPAGTRTLGKIWPGTRRSRPVSSRGRVMGAASWTSIVSTCSDQRPRPSEQASPFAMRLCVTLSRMLCKHCSGCLYYV
jgi:hypothetical protein